MEWNEREKKKTRVTSLMKIRVYSVHVYIVCAHWPNSSVLNFRFFVHFLICYVLFCHLSLVLGLSCQIKIGTLESIVDDFFFASYSFARMSVTLNFWGNLLTSGEKKWTKKKCAYTAQTNAKKNKGWNTCWKNKGPLRKIASLNYFFSISIGFSFFFIVQRLGVRFCFSFVRLDMVKKEGIKKYVPMLLVFLFTIIRTAIGCSSAKVFYYEYIFASIISSVSFGRSHADFFSSMKCFSPAGSSEQLFCFFSNV